MYNLSIAPENVIDTLRKHVLADGYDLTLIWKKVRVFTYAIQKTREPFLIFLLALLLFL